jgi:H+-translocating NAD(P) transhydrogenase subunit alpha
VIVQTRAGAGAHFSDAQYEQAGTGIAVTAEAVYEATDAIFRVQPPPVGTSSGPSEADLLREGTVLIGLLDPLAHPDLVAAMEARRVTNYALDLIPRISRPQGMDALTSMATIAGYKAVLLAADRLDMMFPLMMTVAGTIAPATVLVLGAGVAGLEAIATAKRLGAKVVAFDPRAVVREQIQSLGATFLEMAVTEAVETAGGYAREQSDTFLEAERATIASQLPRVDVMICAAQIFGKRAPVLITTEMVEQMWSGAVIVDLGPGGGSGRQLRPH